MPAIKRKNIQRSDDESSDSVESVKRQRGFPEMTDYHRNFSFVTPENFCNNYCIRSLLNLGFDLETLLNRHEIESRFAEELKRNSETIYTSEQLKNVKEFIAFGVLIDTIDLLYVPVVNETAVIVEVDLTEDDEENDAGFAPFVNRAFQRE